MRKLHRHDLSKEHNLSGNMGKLMPVHWRMCYPNDHVRQRSNFLVRVSPLLAPIYSKVHIKCESFFVPTDLVWTNAQKFYSRGQDGLSTTTVPKFNLSGSPVANTGPGTLLDYLGYGQQPLTLTISALLPRVYNCIYNWHYKNLDLQTDRVFSTADGPDTTTDITLASRCWSHDRFTTARLEPQRGDDVMIPGSIDSAPVIGNGDIPNVRLSGAPTTDRPLNTGTATGATNFMIGTAAGASGNDVKWTPDPDLSGLEADLSAQGGTIRELEEAVAINRFRKRLQQSDGSYPDYTLLTFGIRSPDIELQKPVLLARSSHPLQISEVLQTAQQLDATDLPVGAPVGEYTGHGIASVRGHGFKYKIKRHGYIMTILSVVPEPFYDYTVDKEFLRTTAEDYFDPDLDEIGEEEIDTFEVDGTTTPGTPFGFTFRNYCDRSSLNQLSGEFHTSEPLAYFTQARDITAPAALNSAFVTCDPSDRIFAYGSTQDQLRVKAIHDVKMLRVMRRIPKQGIL